MPNLLHRGMARVNACARPCSVWLTAFTGTLWQGRDGGAPPSGRWILFRGCGAGAWLPRGVRGASWGFQARGL